MHLERGREREGEAGGRETFFITVLFELCTVVFFPYFVICHRSFDIVNEFFFYFNIFCGKTVVYLIDLDKTSNQIDQAMSCATVMVWFPFVCFLVFVSHFLVYTMKSVFVFVFLQNMLNVFKLSMVSILLILKEIW